MRRSSNRVREASTASSARPSSGPTLLAPILLELWRERQSRRLGHDHLQVGTAVGALDDLAHADRLRKLYLRIAFRARGCHPWSPHLDVGGGPPTPANFLALTSSSAASAAPRPPVSQWSSTVTTA